MKKLNLNAIRIDGGTQSRVSINNETVSDYAEAVKVGIEFPPVIVFHDGTDNWLADGFHRFHAHKQAGKASVLADIRQGTVRDAILFSLGANCTHGLRRSNADKRKAVAAMLADEEWATWSDRKIAEACGVTHPFVASLRRPPEVVTVTTKTEPEEVSKVVTVTTPAAPKGDNGYHPAPKKEAPKSAKRSLEDRPADVEEMDEADELAEMRHTLADIAQENETLRDRLAVEAMNASEDEKTQASYTIRDLRERVKALEAENEALKVSRDTYMREAGEAKKSAVYWRKQAEKAAKAVA